MEAFLWLIGGAALVAAPIVIPLGLLIGLGWCVMRFMRGPKRK